MNNIRPQQGVSGVKATPVAAKQATTGSQQGLKLQKQKNIRIESINRMVHDCLMWCNLNGLMLSAQKGADFESDHFPFALLPQKYPKKQVLKAMDDITLFNTLALQVSKDEQYLEQSLAGTAAHDDFTKHLLELMRKTKESRLRLREKGQEIVVAITRSDYMLDEPTQQLLQVELNTISVAFVALSSKVTQLHQYLLSRASANCYDSTNALATLAAPSYTHPTNTPTPIQAPDLSTMSVLPNTALADQANAIGRAHDAYVRMHDSTSSNNDVAPGGRSYVVAVVQSDGDGNQHDREMVAQELWTQHGAQVVFVSFDDVYNHAQLGDDGALRIGGSEVTVVYFRSGYVPTHFTSDRDWAALEKIETSRAAKCPSIPMHLTGSKKIQQVLTSPGALNRFVSDDDADVISQYFANLYSLDPEEVGEAAVKRAVAEGVAAPDSFVLKPSREGGGNNLYGEELKERLESGEELGALVLMQRIKPESSSNVLVKNRRWVNSECVHELGVIGSLVEVGGEVVVNKSGGCLVRSKPSTDNEGGVMAGYSVLNTVAVSEE